MSSSRTDGVAPPFAAPVVPRRVGGDHRSFLKRALPRSLFGRSLLIIVMPLVLLQVIATWIFYERHWDTVARRLSNSVAGDIALMIETMSVLDPDQLARYLATSGA